MLKFILIIALTYAFTPLTSHAMGAALTLELAPVHGKVVNRSGVDLGYLEVQVDIRDFAPGGFDGHSFYGDSCSESLAVLKSPVAQDGTYNLNGVTLKSKSSGKYCVDVTVIHGSAKEVLTPSNPLYVQSNEDYLKHVGKLFADRLFASTQESFTVVVPHDMTLRQYVHQVAAGLPYDDENKYEWQLTLAYTYEGKQAWLSPMAGDLFPAASEEPFGNALADSSRQADQKSFRASRFDPKSPWNNLRISTDESFKPVSRFENGLKYRIALNFWDRSPQGVRAEGFDPMPNPQAWVKPEPYDPKQFMMDRYSFPMPEVTELQNIRVELNPVIEDVRHTGCCDIRGLWMGGSL